MMFTHYAVTVKYNRGKIIRLKNHEYNARKILIFQHLDMIWEATCADHLSRRVGVVCPNHAVSTSTTYSMLYVCCFTVHNLVCLKCAIFRQRKQTMVWFIYSLWFAYSLWYRV